MAVLAVGAAWGLAGCSGGNAGGPPAGFAVNVVTAEAARETVHESVPLIGTLAANEFVEIQSEVDGRIEDIQFQEGQYVKKGGVLFLIDRAKLAAEVNQGEANFNLSAANLKRSEALVENGTISRQEYDQAVAKYEADKAALEFVRQKLRDATVTAAFSGTMGARLVSPGQVVAKGTVLSALIDAHPMKVEMNVPERYAGRLVTGLPVDITVAPYPGETFSGNVYFVSPQVDPVTRTVLVKAKVPNKDGRLQPGLFASLELRLGEVKNAVTVPESAVTKQGETESVYVVLSDDTVERRTITAGVRLKGKVQIVDGVKAGERVVVEGIQKLRPGAAVTYKVEKSTEAAPAEKTS